jgi:Uma2 family endonuclease
LKQQRPEINSGLFIKEKKMGNYISNSFDQMENQELIQKLIDSGYSNLVDAFLLNDSKVYTKKGRLNKSGACRVLKCKPKELEDAIKACQELLKRDLSEEQEEEDLL